MILPFKKPGGDRSAGGEREELALARLRFAAPIANAFI